MTVEASRGPSSAAAGPSTTGSTDVPAVALRGLVRHHRTRRGEPVLATDGVDLDVHRGEILGLLGPNGAGKTTLVRLVMGLLRPEAGTVEVFGRAVAAQPDLAARSAAYLAQEEPALAELDVATAVLTTGRLRGLSREAARGARDGLVTELGLEAFARRPLGRLSGGQRRLALVATALVGDRPLLVLDEPTAGLDPVARRAVWAAVQRRRAERGTTTLLVTHNVLEAESVLDRVAVLDRGRVVAVDTPGRLKASVDDQVRLTLVWRTEAPLDDPAVGALAAHAVVTGRRWSLRLPADRAREALAAVTAGPAFVALDDFTLTTPSLEDVYLALGGTADDLERA